MLIPIGDSPNPPSRPWVTYALIALNIGIYLAMLPLAFEAASPDDPLLLDYLQQTGRGLGQGAVSRYELVVWEHGFQPAAPGLLDLFSAMFLHGGALHVVGNCLFLWIFGNNVEHRLGAPLFLAVYLATGIVADLGDLALRADSLIPSVGASGAISGLLGCYFVWFPRNHVRVLIALFPIYVRVVDLPARVVLGIYVVVDNLLPILIGLDGGVAHGAHLGGFVAGALFAWGHAQLRPPEPEEPPPVEVYLLG